ncbi:hypothetical protein EGP98_04395 [bacterium]|nr:hypothetical protein [bacterium]
MVRIKNFLNYYYHLYPVEIIKEKENYKFYLNDKLYILYLITNKEQEVKEQIILNKELVYYNYPSLVINNVFNNSYSLIEGKNYILVCYNFSNRKIMETDLTKDIYINKNNYLILNRSNWYDLWCKKVDYFEYQKNYIKDKYPLLYNTIDYFIGYAEVAISYLSEVNKIIKRDSKDYLTICHKRVYFNDDLNNFYNPFSLIIDYKARDVGEYLKSLLFYGYQEKQIKELLLVINSSYQRHLLMARVLFPSFYFDCYEDIINGITGEEKIISILNKIKDYEDFLVYLYNLLRETDYLIQIDFLEKPSLFH